ncbi:putative ankyrin-containing lipoprotein Lxx09580 [Mytilus edulis]|uniref:putative ankyrin-containing lipoprotein Lxx09580 n=1 Tax=Mytilus edulis TaxID=6550 RepID=UPI0039F12FE6
MESLNKQLCNAASKGRLKDLKRCIQKGADLEYRDSKGMTPLLNAAQKGHLEILRHLIRVGCDKEGRSTKTESTPLMHAAAKGHLEAVRYLITVGCEKESRNKVIIDTNPFNRIILLYKILLLILSDRFNASNSCKTK